MSDYAPGALSALLAGSNASKTKKKIKSIKKVKPVKTETVSKLKSKKRLSNENHVVPTKKAKHEVTAAKKPKKEVLGSEDGETTSEDEVQDKTTNAASEAFSAGVMKLKPKKAEDVDIKVKREKAKLKKKDVAKQRAGTAEREIFVGNVAASVRRREIEKLFKKYGPIEKVWSRSVVGLSEKKTRTLVRKYKKIGSNALNVINFYIRYKSAEDATKALEMNGEVYKDLHLRVTLVNKKSLAAGSSAFVSNLPFDITEEEIHKHFQDCGEITAIRIVHDKFTGLGKGVAFVQFAQKESLEKAFKLHGTTLKEREIRVSKVLKRNQLAKEEASKAKKPNQKQKEDERIKEKIADYVIQKKPADKKNSKPFRKPGGIKGKKIKKGSKAPVKSIMT